MTLFLWCTVKYLKTYPYSEGFWYAHTPSYMQFLFFFFSFNQNCIKIELRLSTDTRLCLHSAHHTVPFTRCWFASVYLWTENYLQIVRCLLLYRPILWVLINGHLLKNLQIWMQTQRQNKWQTAALCLCLVITGSLCWLSYDCLYLTR